MSQRSSPAFAVGGVSYLGADGLAGTIIPPPGGWACFHCGDRFYTFKAGLRHFGDPEQQRAPLCQWTL